MGKDIGKNISKALGGKYSQKHLDHAKQSAAGPFKTFSKTVIQKTAGATGDWIGNKIANISTKTPKDSQENDSETVIDEHNKETPKERYISPEGRRTRNY